jgi:hypothetical protein
MSFCSTGGNARGIAYGNQASLACCKASFLCEGVAKGSLCGGVCVLYHRRKMREFENEHMFKLMEQWMDVGRHAGGSLDRKN